jgi:hypothetical protein
LSRTRGGRQRQELELHRCDPVGRHHDRDAVGRVAGRGDGEDVRAGGHAGAALRQLERRPFSFEAQLGACGLAVDEERAVDAIELRLHHRGAPLRQRQDLLVRPVAVELDHHRHLGGRQRKRHRRRAALAQVLAVDVDGGAGRLGLDPEQGQGRPQPLERLQQVLAIALRHLVGEDLGVPAVRLVVAPELLEAARDVEDDVAVADQAVGGEELGEGFLDLALPVEVGGAVEAEVRLVGDGVGPRERRAEDERERSAEDAHEAYRSALMPRSGAVFLRAVSTLRSLKLKSSPSFSTGTFAFSW